MIKIKSNNYTIKASGYIMERAKIIGKVVTVATDGSKEVTYNRAVKYPEIVIKEMNEDNYKNLLNMFLFDNSFSIEDTEREYKDKEFFIDGDTFSLTETPVNKTKGFYYSGNIVVDKF